MFKPGRAQSPVLMHLCLALVLAVVWAGVLQLELGSSGASDAASGAPNARLPGGRHLYLLLIDALRNDEVALMPRLSALGAQSFEAEVEPCLDLFTTACMKEALTGRASFDLLAPFEDFGVAKPNVGANLLRDARAAGLHVEMLSTGHLASFRHDVDADPRVDEPFSSNEATLGLEAAARSDLVLHHWVWHDVASHHMVRHPADHIQSLADADEAVGRILAGLPDGMDLIVMGDHGHLPDGRHLQGMDLPTVVVVHSQNVLPAHPSGRIPIAAIRFLGSAVTGILGPTLPADPMWAGWLSPTLRGTWTGGAPLLLRDGNRAGPGLAVIALLIGALATWSVGAAGGAAVAWGTVLGAGFGVWLNHFDQRIGGPKPAQYIWMIPVLCALVGLVWRRRASAAWGGGVLGAGLLLLLLYPGLQSWGLVQNALMLALPGVVGATGFRMTRREEKGVSARWWQAAAVVATAVVWLSLDQLGDLNANFFHIRSYAGAGWERRSPMEADALAAVLAGLSHALLEGPSPWVIASALGAVLGRQIPADLHMASVGLLAVAAICLRPPWRARGMIIGASTASAYLYPGVQRVGVLAVVAIIGLGLRIVARSGEQGRISRWAAALVVVGGAYLGLAWTCGLNTSGINYSFAVQWTEGPWHERLWWLMGAATALQIFLPAILIAEQLRASFPERGEEIISLAGQLTLVRFAVVIALTTCWLFVEGGDAGTARLSVVLQDALAWLLLGLALTGTWALGRARGGGATSSQEAAERTNSPLRSPAASARGGASP